MRLAAPLLYPACRRVPMTVTGEVQQFLVRAESVKDLGLEQAAAVEMA